MAGARRGRRMKRYAEHFRRFRRKHGRPVAYGRHAIELHAAQGFERFRDRGQISPRWRCRPKDLASRDSGPKLASNSAPRRRRGVGEDANLVARGRREK